MIDYNGYLRTGQVARMLDVSTQRVRQLVDEGKLEGIKTPFGLLFHSDEIEGFKAVRVKTVHGWKRLSETDND